MGFYEKYILPVAADFVCGLPSATEERKKVVPEANGLVLEVGIGSAHNLPYYTAGNVRRLYGLDPSRELWNLARRKLKKSDLAVEFIEGAAEKIPMEDNSMDTVVSTFTLCTVRDPLLALSEMRRVLKPQGRLLFCEHGLAPEKRTRRWQYLLNPIWKRFGGGCNLTRPIRSLLEQAGFKMRRMETSYARGWRPVSYHYRGTATP